MTEYLGVGRHDAKVTSPDKLLFPKAKLAKRELAHHYERVAPVMLPYVKDRPLALQAFPAGIDNHGFFLKEVQAHFPDWVDAEGDPWKGMSRRARALPR